MGERIGILGLGESGTGAAILAHDRGMQVWASDGGALKPEYRQMLSNEGIPFEEKGHDEERLLKCDLIVKSPGIAENSPLVLKLRKKGIPVISEIEFAGYHTKSTMVCITGTNGKTTTTALTHHVLKKGGIDAGLGGNIGKSFAWMVAREPHDTYVLEISSFMLDGMFDFRAHFAILTNITPDHLDRYDYRLDYYAASKCRILQNMRGTDVFAWCADDELSRKYLSQYRLPENSYPFSLEGPQEFGAFAAGGNLYIKTRNQPETLDIPMNHLALKGRHNAYNSMAAAIIGNAFNIRKEIIRESLSDFVNIEHRLESVGKIGGIEFINDSKATNVNSVWYALESMDRPVVWIAGGVDKGNDYSILQPLVRDKVRLIVCLGIDNRKLHEAFSKDVDLMVNASSMPEAVHIAYKLANKGDVVLLSPACASFDLFSNYEDRGNQFKNAVRDL